MMRYVFADFHVAKCPSGRGLGASRVIASFGCLLFVLGCGAEGIDLVGKAIRRDSSGIAIVDNSPGATWGASGWVLDSLPNLQIGAEGDDGPETFSGISGLAQLPDRSVAVLDRATQEIRFFDSAGTFMKRLGRVGSGPGEFLEFGLVPAQRYDSLLIVDRSRLSIVLPNENKIRYGRLIGRPVGQPLGILKNAVLLSETSVYIGSGSEGYISESPLSFTFISAISDAENTLNVDTITRVITNTPDGVGRETPIPFSVRSRAATDSSFAYYISGRTSAIGMYDSLGNLRRVVRVRGPQERVSAREFDRRVESSIRMAANPPLARRLYASIPRVKLMPIWQNLSIDSDGNLWAERYRSYSTLPSIWSVFAADGEALGTVELPRDLSVRQIGTDFVLGLWRDSVGVQYVRRYTLHRNGK